MSARIGIVSEWFRGWWTRRSILGKNRRRRADLYFNQQMAQIEGLEERTLLSALSPLAGDFDGNGKTDLYKADSGTGDVNVYLSDGAALTKSLWDNWGDNNDWIETRVGDFNGDGRDDLLSRHNLNNQLQVSISNGKGFSSSVWEGTWGSWVDPVVGDFNADGRDDFAARNGTGDWQVAVSSGTGFQSSGWGNWSTGVSWTDFRVGDFNGDTREDIIARNPTTGDWQAAVSTGTDFFNQSWGNWSTANSWEDILVGDFDGDGADELVGRNSTTHAWQVSNLNDNSFTNSAWGSASPATSWEHVHIADVNKDGNDDLVGKLSGNWRVALSNGTTFTDQHWQRSTGGEWFTSLSHADIANVEVIDDTGKFEKALEDFEFVRNTIDFQAYHGSMKGAQATEETRAGNAWDQSALLVDKLTTSGLESKFAIGTVNASGTAIADLQNWLGTKTVDDSGNVLLNAGLMDTYDLSVPTFNFKHAWVQAWLPGPNGLDWQNLDPSWKFRDYQDGIPDLLFEVSFNENDYLAPVTQNYSADFENNEVTGLPRIHDTSYLGSRWEEVADVASFNGDVEIISNKLQAESTVANNEHSVALVKDVYSRNGSVEADFFVPSGNRVSLLGRYGKNSDGDTVHYTAELKNDSNGVITVRLGRDLHAGVSFSRVNIGTQLTLPSTLTSGHLQFEIKGETLKLIIKDDNGVIAGTLTEVDASTDALMNAGQFGVSIVRDVTGAAAATLDNFSMSATEIQELSPVEFFENKVEEHLRANYPGVSLADVPYYGPILAASFDTLPQPPSYVEVGSPTFYSSLPELETHRVRVTLTDQNSVTHFNELLIVPDVSLQRINVSYVRNDTTGALTPELRLDGVMVASGSEITNPTPPYDPADVSVTLSLKYYKPGTSSTGNADKSYDFDRGAGQFLAVGLDAAQVSEENLQRLRRETNKKNIELSQLSTWQLNLHDSEILEDVVEYTLALALNSYWEDLNRSTEQIGLLTDAFVTHNGVGFGISTTEPTVQYHTDRQNFVVPDGFGVDLPNLHYGIIPGGQYSITELNERFSMLSWENSYREHNVIENLLNIESVSTIKGLQWAEDNGYRIYELEWDDTLQKVVDHRNNDDVIDMATALQYNDPNNITSIVDLVMNDKLIVTVPERDVTINDWSEIVYFYYDVHPNGSYQNIGYIIGNGTNGGSAAGRALRRATIPRIQTRASRVWAGDPVDVANGNMFRDETDITHPNVGIPLEFSRHYDSQNSADYGLGTGWTFTYGDRLESSPEKVVWVSDDGGKHSFFKDLDGNYDTPAALIGSSLVFDGVSSTYALSDKHGLVRSFDSNGKLIQIQDRNGNELTVSYHGTGDIAKVSNGDVDLLTFSNRDSATLLPLAYDLDQTHNFTPFTSDWEEVDHHYNGNGRNERYLKSLTGPNSYYILPDGSLYQWVSSVWDGTPLGTLDPRYHADPMLLVDAINPVDRRAFDLDKQWNFKPFPDSVGIDYYYDSRGFKERYLQGMILEPDGKLYQWNSATNLYADKIYLATLDPSYHANPHKLVDAYYFEDNSLQDLAFELDEVHDFKVYPGYKESDFSFNFRGRNEKYLQGYYILPDGKLYDWVSTVWDGVLIGTFDSSYHADPTLLVNASIPEKSLEVVLSDDPGMKLVYDLDEQFSFGYHPSDSLQNFSYGYNSLSLNEKHLRDFYITADDPQNPTISYLYQWDGVTATLIDTLDGRFYADPSLMIAAYDPFVSNAYSLDQRYDFDYHPSDDPENPSYLFNSLGLSEKHIDDFYILFAGPFRYDLYQWDGVTATFIDSFDDRYFNNPSLLVDADHPLLMSSNFSSKIWTYDFEVLSDYKDHLVSVSHPSDVDTPVTRVEYDYINDGTRLQGFMDKITEPDGGTHDYSYFVNGRAFEVTDQEGFTTHLTYDLFRNITEFTDERGNTTEYDHNSRGLLERKINPDRTTVKREWDDEKMQLTSSTDAFGNKELYEYETGTGNLKKQTDYDGLVTEYTYDPTFNLPTQIKKGAGTAEEQITNFTYDTVNNNGDLLEVEDAEGNVTKMTYLSNGLLATRIEPKGNVPGGTPENYTTTYEYTTSGVIEKETLPDLDGPGGDPAPEITYTFDEWDNILTRTDPTGFTTTYAYDQLNRRIEQSIPAPNGPGSLVTRFAYDVSGNLISVTDANGNTTTNLYDSKNNLIEVRSPDGTFVKTFTMERKILSVRPIRWGVKRNSSSIHSTVSCRC